MQGCLSPKTLEQVRLPLHSPFPFHPLPCLHLEVGPLNPATGLGERCKLPYWGLEQSPSQNRICCILALKSAIC